MQNAVHGHLHQLFHLENKDRNKLKSALKDTYLCMHI